MNTGIDSHIFSMSWMEQQKQYVLRLKDLEKSTGGYLVNSLALNMNILNDPNTVSHKIRSLKQPALAFDHPNCQTSFMCSPYRSVLRSHLPALSSEGRQKEHFYFNHQKNLPGGKAPYNPTHYTYVLRVCSHYIKNGQTALTCPIGVLCGLSEHEVLETQATVGRKYFYKCNPSSWKILLLSFL